MTPATSNDAARFRGDIERLIGGEASHLGQFGLAVSGGPDSMAMLALANAAFPGRIAVASVDHGLRQESAIEAAMVAGASASLGIPNNTLHPHAPIVGSSLQRRAREARYAALAEWAVATKQNFVLTAHHADDQAETLLMRLNRASGLAGLSAIRAMRREGGMTLLRPLLGWRRSELRAIAIESGLPFVDDPANCDPRHDRSRMRALLAETSGLDPAALAASAAYLAEAEEVVEREAAAIWSERWRGPDNGMMLDNLPRELRRRLVRRAIRASRAAFDIVLPTFLDASNIEPLLDAIEGGTGAVQGGVRVAPSPAGWVFRPAPPRRASPPR